MSTPKGSSQRRSAPAQKENAVRLVRLRREETGEGHGPVKAVADQLGFGVESVRSWVKQADIDDGVSRARRRRTRSGSSSSSRS